MNILIIGGTRFVGRHLSDSLLCRGHDLTLFHRGETNPNVFPRVDRIFGDRETELENLGDKSWDVVIDTCGYYPEHVQKSVAYLADKAERYVFISSAAVYEPTTEVGIDETSPLQTNPVPSNEVAWWHTEYARNKVRCEQEVLEGFGPSNSLIVRPGMIMGPYDPMNYFTYWVVRVRQGGDIVAPGEKDHPLQFIDARDLASFTAEMIDQSVSDVFTVDGPTEPISFSSFLETLRDYFDSDATFHWIDNEQLIEHGIRPDGSGIPYWLPDPEARAYFQMSNDKALNHGLEIRPLTESADDVFHWYETQIHGSDEGWVDGLPPDKGLKPSEESELLEQVSNE